MNATQNHSFSVLFWLNKQRTNSVGESPIYVRITVNGKRAELSLQRFIPEQLWNQKAQKLAGKGDIQITLNGLIDLTRGNIQKIYNQLLAAGENITAEIIKLKLSGRDITHEQKTIIQAIEYHNLKLAELIKIGKAAGGTLTKYETTKKKVVSFLKHKFKVSDKPLSEIRYSFITEFEHFLITKQNVQNNTTHKYIRNLKKIMNMSVNLEWIQANPFTQFKCSYVNPKKEILTQEEINLLIQKEIPIQRLAEVRDVFVFCCYTGFAYTDAYKFERDAVTKGIDGELWLTTNRQKTGICESVPLLPIPLQIIEKYRENEYCQTYNKLLPVNSNQRFNAYLKELADICGIQKHLTTHIARHTFATTVTLANGVPIETVSSMLGHAKISSTQIYAKVVERKVSEDMKALKARYNTISVEKQSKLG